MDTSNRSGYLNSLTDHSLLVREIFKGKTYWRMLELIHEYAVLKLTKEKRSHVEQLRFDYFLNKFQEIKQNASREDTGRIFPDQLQQFSRRIEMDDSRYKPNWGFNWHPIG